MSALGEALADFRRFLTSDGQVALLDGQATSPRRGAHRTHLLAILAGLGLAGSLGAPPATAGITGVCPDGSMFIVNRKADIPCAHAKQVDPHDMPPIRPAYLPRPHAWQVFQNQQDPNNPYNLIDGAREVREAALPPTRSEPSAAPEPEAQQRAALPPVSAPQATRSPVPAPTRQAPSLSTEDLRDLALFIELSQTRLPARFDAGSNGPVRIALAPSRAFQAVLQQHLDREQLGPVVVFAAHAGAPAAFHANFTFVQGHVAFHPDPKNPEEFGVLRGALGELADGGAVIGYAVLPPNVALDEPMDVYWNDRRISVALLR